MIDIEQHALRAFEQDAFAGAAFVFQQFPDHVHERQDARRHAEQFISQRRRRNLGEPEPAYDAVIDFLGLPRWRPEAFERHNARPSSPLSPELRARLTGHFAPHDERLAALLGKVPPWRR